MILENKEGYRYGDKKTFKAKKRGLSREYKK